MIGSQDHADKIASYDPQGAQKIAGQGEKIRTASFVYSAQIKHNHNVTSYG